MQRERRDRLFALVAGMGLALGATGTHPWADYREQRIIDTPHYNRLRRELGWVAQRNNSWSLHLHMGIRGADRAIAVCDRLRQDLPLLLAVSANSPFLDRRDSGLHSVRTEIFTRTFPRCGIPSPFGDWATYAEFVDLLVRTDTVVESTQLWWSVRPHHRFGTVEVRICDAQTRGDESFGLAALIAACIAQAAIEYDEGGGDPLLADREIEENLWRAIRHGMSGRQIDFRAEAEVEARAALEALLARTEPARSQLGSRSTFPSETGPSAPVRRSTPGFRSRTSTAMRWPRPSAPTPGRSRRRKPHAARRLRVASAAPYIDSRAAKPSRRTTNLTDFLTEYGVVVALVCAGAAVIYGLLVTRACSRNRPETSAMQEISDAVQEGARAYLNRQYTIIAAVAIPIAILLWILQNWETAVGFVIGGILSGSAGFIGMNLSVRANARVAEAARGGVPPALDVAFKGGSVTGLLVVGLALFGVAGYFGFLVLTGAVDTDKEAVDALVGLGFGGSLISVFARLGGGIFTKAADVGADLVGKVEAGIPEDDPRNPAVIADNVGDNVGDCAGMAADLFETYAVTSVAVMLLGVLTFSGAGGDFTREVAIYPLVIGAVAIIASIIGALTVRTKSDRVEGALYQGLIISGILSIAAFYPITHWMMSEPVRLGIGSRR